MSRLFELYLARSAIAGVVGWDGRIRTYGTLYQKQLPYHLATSQRVAVIKLMGRNVQAPFLTKIERIFGFVKMGLRSIVRKTMFGGRPEQPLDARQLPQLDVPAQFHRAGKCVRQGRKGPFAIGRCADD